MPNDGFSISPAVVLDQAEAIRKASDNLDAAMNDFLHNSQMLLTANAGVSMEAFNDLQRWWSGHTGIMRDKLVKAGQALSTITHGYRQGDLQSAANILGG